MPRVIRVLAAGSSDCRPSSDSVLLATDQRRVQRGAFVGINGTHCLVDLPETIWLRMGDALELDDGTVVDVVAEPEPLIEVRASDLLQLAKIAWQLGDRHLPVQVLANRLRVRRDPAARALLEKLNARVVEIDAPFDPEGGAYATTHRHEHHHAHDDDHDHGHDHRHRHDHGSS